MRNIIKNSHETNGVHSETMHYQYLPLTDYYYTTSHEKTALSRHGNKDYIRILWIVAFLVGIIGILNFTNIYTVIMSKRAQGVWYKESIWSR